MRNPNEICKGVCTNQGIFHNACAVASFSGHKLRKLSISQAACAQCDTVSCILGREAEGPDYCTKMCTNENSSELPEWGQEHNVSQAYLKPWTSDLTGYAPDDSDQPTSLSFSSMKMATCPRCKETVPKKLILTHIKACKGARKPRHTQRQQDPSPEEGKESRADPETSYQEDPPSVTDEPPELATDPYTLAQQLREARSEISSLKEEVVKLREELSKKNEILLAYRQEAESVQHMAETARANLNERVASSVSAFQEECGKLKAGIDQCFAGLNQVTEEFQEELQNVVHSLFPTVQVQGCATSDSSEERKPSRNSTMT